MMTAADMGRPAGAKQGDVWHDHVAHTVPNLDGAKARLEQLGFQLTPQSNQLGGSPLAETGVANRCVMMRGAYLEITGTITTEERPAVVAFNIALKRHTGLHLLAFGVPDPEQEAERLNGNGLGPAALHRTQRMIGTETGEELGRFTVVVTPRDHFPEARMPLVRQETPELVWQERYLDHANGAMSIEEVVAVVADPAETASRFERFTGGTAAPFVKGMSMVFKRGRLTFLPADAAEDFGDLPPLPSLVGYSIKVADLAVTASVLAGNGVEAKAVGKDCLAVAGGAALGGMLFFCGPGGVPPWH